ncbi:hypothetical protein AB2762_07085 [Acinetobacter indicus]
MVVMAARAAQTVGQELLKAHQNRHTNSIYKSKKKELMVQKRASTVIW